MERTNERRATLFTDQKPQTASGAWKSLCDGAAIALLNRVENGLRRALERTLKTLQELQASRPEPLPPQDDAKVQNEPDPPQVSEDIQVVDHHANIERPSPACAEAQIRQLPISLERDHNLLYKYSDSL